MPGRLPVYYALPAASPCKAKRICAAYLSGAAFPTAASQLEQPMPAQLIIPIHFIVVVVCLPQLALNFAKNRSRVSTAH